MSSNPNEILTWGGVSVDPFDAVPEQIDIRGYCPFSFTALPGERAYRPLLLGCTALPQL